MGRRKTLLLVNSVCQIIQLKKGLDQNTPFIPHLFVFLCSFSHLLFLSQTLLLSPTAPTTQPNKPILSSLTLITTNPTLTRGLQLNVLCFFFSFLKQLRTYGFIFIWVWLGSWYGFGFGLCLKMGLLEVVLVLVLLYFGGGLRRHGLGLILAATATYLGGIFYSSSEFL